MITFFSGSLKQHSCDQFINLKYEWGREKKSKSILKKKGFYNSLCPCNYIRFEKKIFEDEKLHLSSTSTIKKRRKKLSQDFCTN